MIHLDLFIFFGVLSVGCILSMLLGAMLRDREAHKTEIYQADLVQLFKSRWEKAQEIVNGYKNPYERKRLIEWMDIQLDDYALKIRQSIPASLDSEFNKGARHGLWSVILFLSGKD